MQHLNSHQLAVVDVKTTGIDVLKHEIYEICILPLDNNLEVDKRFIPFTTTLKIQKPYNIDLNQNKSLVTKYSMGYNSVLRKQDHLTEAITSGLASDIVSDMLVEWVASLKLPEYKKLMPIAYDWRFQSKFLEYWLGYQTFDEIFNYQYRDILSQSLFENDIADYFGNPIPFAKNDLQYLCSSTQTYRDMKTALDDARFIQQVYKKMTRRSIVR
jgi:DNA polymerase III epsilon subunit-like protein